MKAAWGSVGSLFRSADLVKRDIDLYPPLTNRNFAINHIRKLDIESFQHTLQAALPSFFRVGRSGI